MLKPSPRYPSAKALFRLPLLAIPLTLWIGFGGLSAEEPTGTAVRKGPGVIGPDVIVGDLPNMSHFGPVGNIHGYSVATTSCNTGDDNLLWQGNTPNHPVIGQNLYRLKDGRMEQLGQSWLKHGFTALTGNICGLGCNPPGTGALLGVGCSDPYGASLNGNQTRLGPRFQVNASTGEFSFPYADQGNTGNEIYKRLQVLDADVDPAQNVGARYFIEGHYVTPDDAAAGNKNNNASYREVFVDAGNLDLDTNGGFPTQREKPAIQAWQDIDPTVTMANVDVPADGRFHVASKASDNGNGTWRYTYGVHNLSSHMSAREFSVPLGAGAVITNIGFRDVNYHSGEPYDLTDWASSVAGGFIRWSTDTFAANADANALRWGTMYSFWFDADVAPEDVDAELGLFRTSMNMTAAVRGPGISAIFTDGFESGDTTLWSLTLP